MYGSRLGACGLVLGTSYAAFERVIKQLRAIAAKQLDDIVDPNQART